MQKYNSKAFSEYYNTTYSSVGDFATGKYFNAILPVISLNGELFVYQYYVNSHKKASEVYYTLIGGCCDETVFIHYRDDINKYLVYACNATGRFYNNTWKPIDSSNHTVPFIFEELDDIILSKLCTGCDLLHYTIGRINPNNLSAFKDSVGKIIIQKESILDSDADNVIKLYNSKTVIPNDDNPFMPDESEKPTLKKDLAAFKKFIKAKF